jgi:FMNH2-dependent dimethyl sulfone monooxygenase
MEFGIWTPVPHAVVPEPRLQAAATQARTRVDDPDYVDESFAFIRDVICRADELDFEHTLIAERLLGPDHSAWMLTASLAALTRRIHLLCAVHPALYPPQLVAKMGASVDRISAGRFHLNIVSGWWRDEYEMYSGRWIEDEDDRYARELEYIQVIKGFWTEDPFSFDGQYYQVDKGSLPIPPVQKPWPPIFAASRHEGGMDLIARECDWWFASGYEHSFRDWQNNLRIVRESIEGMRERAARHGRTLRFAMSAHVNCADTDDQALAAADWLEEYGKTNRIAWIAARHQQPGLVGSAQTIAERMLLYKEAGVEMFLMHFHPMLEGLERFGREIAPLVRPPVAVATA